MKLGSLEDRSYLCPDDNIQGGKPNQHNSLETCICGDMRAKKPLDVWIW